MSRLVIRCEEHPAYRGAQEPKNGCPHCWAIWYLRQHPNPLMTQVENLGKHLSGRFMGKAEETAITKP